MFIHRNVRVLQKGCFHKVCFDYPQPESTSLEATEKVPKKGGISGFFPLIPPFSYIMKKNVGGGVLHA